MCTKENVEKCELPPVGENVLVQCRDFRCLAYRAADGKWRTVYSNQELKDIVKILALSQEDEY